MFRSEEHTSELQSHSDLHSFPTRRSSDLFEERGCGAFAVGAGDVGAGISAFRVAEALGEDGDVFKIELCGGSLRRRGQFAAEGEQVADRGLVFHLSSRASRESW